VAFYLRVYLHEFVCLPLVDLNLIRKITHSE